MIFYIRRQLSDFIKILIQWNLPITDPLGTDLLSRCRQFTFHTGILSSIPREYNSFPLYAGFVMSRFRLRQVHCVTEMKDVQRRLERRDLSQLYSAVSANGSESHILSFLGRWWPLNIFGILCLIAGASAGRIAQCWFREAFKQLSVFLRGVRTRVRLQSVVAVAVQTNPNPTASTTPFEELKQNKVSPLRNECVCSEKKSVFDLAWFKSPPPVEITLLACQLCLLTG
jgi:hypothetical protein